MAAPVVTTAAKTQPWQVALLGLLHAPVTPTNLKTLNGWQAGESGNGELATSNNPLNTERDASRYPLIPGTGVPQYPSLDVGVQETAATLEQSNYTSLVAALRAGITPSPAALAPWDPGSPSYGGNIENDIAGAPATASGLTVSGGTVSAGAGSGGGITIDAGKAGLTALDALTLGGSSLLPGVGGGYLPSSSDVTSIPGDIAHELGLDPTKWVRELVTFIKDESALGLSYVLLTLVGLVFVVVGALELFGYSPRRVAGAIPTPTKLAEDIPF